MSAPSTRRQGPSRGRNARRAASPTGAAQEASLRYVRDDVPGIRRRRSGRGFSYRGTDGAPVRNREVLSRIRGLAVPPAWTDVWICPHPNGHLQATGRDARRRKQYRYHPRWREVRDATKYDRMIPFGRVLPRIRRRVTRDLRRRGLPKEKLLALIVRLLEATYLRVGNDEYVRSNGSFGLTTLLDRHVRIQASRIRFRFRGKRGKEHTVQVTDRRLAGLVKRVRELPGQELFQYLDPDGDPRPITSTDVNDYLKAIAGEAFTAKDFRTWAGTVLAARQLRMNGGPPENGTRKSAVVRAAEAVAEQLGNTPAICRKCYIHPAVLEAFTDPGLRDLWTRTCGDQPGSERFTSEEAGLLRFLEAQAPNRRS